MPETNISHSPDTPWQGLMDAKKAISLLSVSRAHFYNLLRAGKFPQPTLREGPRFTRWKARDVQAWLADPQGWIATNGTKPQDKGAA